MSFTAEVPVTPQLLTTTEIIDPIFLFIFGVCLVMLLGVTIAMVYFVIRYNRKRCPVPASQKDSNIWLEIVWTVIPTLLVLAMFYYGWAGYLALRNVPEGAMEVKVTGRMWSWLFEYPNGKTSDKLYVPVGQPVKVTMTSVDVLHAFYVPAFRVKRDVVPGRESHVWFIAPKAGSYDVFCAEYCGAEHAAMITTIEALPPEDYAAWYAAAAGSAQPAGEQLLAQHGCLGCHSLDGSKKAGPSFKGIWGRSVQVTTGGAEGTLTSDADYLRRAILEPHADVVVGYPAIMPSYQGKLPAEELEDILEYFQNSAAAGETKDND